jgi:hypothetical protein
MRIFSKCLFVLLLPAILMAQTSSSSESTQSSSGSQPPASTQPQPENPLQEQPKTTEVQPAAPTASRFDVNTATGEDQQVGEIKLMTRYTELNGDTARSFRVPGSNNLAEFNYFSDQGFLINHRIQVLTSFRATDDRSIDPERVSLQKGYVRIFSDRDEIIAGDALVTLSRLTFNQNVKGLYGNFKLGDDWRIAGFSGIFIDRYGSLYKDLSGRPFMAATSGARVERSLSTATQSLDSTSQTAVTN